MSHVTDYGKTSCSYCEKHISRCGFAVINHGRMHARKGDCIEVAYRENGNPGDSGLFYATVDAKLENGIKGLGLSRWQIDFNKRT